MNDEFERAIAGQLAAFGRNLKAARVRAGLTQAMLSAATSDQIASGVALDRAAISRLECGRRAPDLPTLLRVCAALETEPRRLLRGIGPARGPRGVPRGARGSAVTPAEIFGAGLKWARTRAGISQEQLALDARVDRAAISVYEKGRREPNLRTVLKLAHELRVRPALLLAGIVWRDERSAGEG